MIPRIIHYCWLSQDPIPTQLQCYIEGWRKLLPDYEFVFWDNACLSRFSDVPWVREAFEAHKYAFAADYVRFYAVFTMGGIYLDIDVELLRPFDDLLQRPYLMGEEYALHPEAGVLGAEPGSELMRLCMDFYKSRHFSPDALTLSTCKAPQVMFDSISVHRPFLLTEDHPSFHPDSVCLLPKDYLTAMNADTGIAHPTANTFTIHHYAGSWCYQTPLSKLRRWLKVSASRLFGERFVRFIRSKF